MDKKNYTDWHKLKTWLNNKSEQEPYFYEREIWWISIGQNIRFEEDGKGHSFVRPVLVIRKFNQYLFWGLPLSTTVKRGKYYYPFKYKDSQSVESVAILSQLRVYDAKRLQDKEGIIDEPNFKTIQQKLIDLIGGVPKK